MKVSISNIISNFLMLFANLSIFNVTKSEIRTYNTYVIHRKYFPSNFQHSLIFKRKTNDLTEGDGVLGIVWPWWKTAASENWFNIFIGKEAAGERKWKAAIRLL